jgi:hypothetical protein
MLIGERLAKDLRPCLTRQNVDTVTLHSKLWMSIKILQPAINTASREFRMWYFSTLATTSFTELAASATQTALLKRLTNSARIQTAEKQQLKKDREKTVSRSFFRSNQNLFCIQEPETVTPERRRIAND